jgi:hypothetical protein
MDNKSKTLYAVIAVLLVSNGYLLYRLGETEPVVDEKKPVWVYGEYGSTYKVAVRLEDVKSFWSYLHSEGYELTVSEEPLKFYVNDEKEIEKINKYIGKDYSSMPTKKKK